MMFAHFADLVRSHLEPRSLRNICFFQVYIGTDCRPESPTSALCRGTVVVLDWCQSLLKAHFLVKLWSLTACEVAEVFGSDFGKRRLTSSDLTGVLLLNFFCAS